MTSYEDVLEQASRVDPRCVGASRRTSRSAPKGDGFFVAFPSPIGAVAACLEAQLALASARLAAGRRPPRRMGLHTGEATPAADGDYVGLAVHHAARVGDGGQRGPGDRRRRTRAARRCAARVRRAERPRHVPACETSTEPARLFAVVHPDLPLGSAGPRVRRRVPCTTSRSSGRIHRTSRRDRRRSRSCSRPIRSSRSRARVASGRRGSRSRPPSLATGAFPDGAWLVELARDRRSEPRRCARRVVRSGWGPRPVRPHATSSSSICRDEDAPARPRQLRAGARCGRRPRRRGAAVVRGRDRARDEPGAAPDPRRGAWRLPSPALPLTDPRRRASSTRAVALLRPCRSRIRFVLDETDAGRRGRSAARLDGIPLALELAAAQLRRCRSTDVSRRVSTIGSRSLVVRLSARTCRVSRRSARRSIGATSS